MRRITFKVKIEIIYVAFDMYGQIIRPVRKTAFCKKKKK